MIKFADHTLVPHWLQLIAINHAQTMTPPTSSIGPSRPIQELANPASSASGLYIWCFRSLNLVRPICVSPLILLNPPNPPNPLNPLSTPNPVPSTAVRDNVAPGTLTRPWPDLYCASFFHPRHLLQNRNRDLVTVQF